MSIYAESTVNNENKEEITMSNSVITSAEIAALNNAMALGGYDSTVADKKLKVEQDRLANLLAEGGRVVDKIEPINIESYKLRFVPAEALWLKLFGAELSTCYETKRNADDAYSEYKACKSNQNKAAFEAAKQQFCSAFKALEDKIKNEFLKPGAYEVQMSDCRVRSNRRSLASDIAGVQYQQADDKVTVDNNIIMVAHRTYEFIPRSWMLHQSANDAERRSENLCKNLIYALQRKGLDLVSNKGYRLHYNFWASSSSHQKVGIAYFGESRMMKRTEEIRNFGTDYLQLNEAGGDNGSEYIKRQAVLFTPSAPIFNPTTSEPLRLRDIAMFNDIDITRESDNVANVTNNGEITIGKETIDMTMADGLAIAKAGWIRSGQTRGWAIKCYMVKGDEAMKYINPASVITDIDGNVVNLDNVKIVMTKSCWKGSKLGYTWAQFVAKAEELTKVCPVLDQLRCVRWADSSKDKGRHLSRQSIQQWITATDAQVSKLASGAIRGLNIRKTLHGALYYETELSRPELERTDYNRALQTRPSILCSEQFQTVLKKNWHNQLAENASGAIRIKGQYPYIAMDPVAILQILLEGRDANDPDLGVLKDGQVNLPNYEEGTKLYGVRYPNNFLCGMIFEQHNHPAFADVGDTAILPYHGFAIVRADGDFDGDEMLFTPNKLVIELMSKVIEKINPPLVKFPHAKAARHEVDEKKTAMEIAVALYNGQAYNKVGQYSNVAMKLFSKINIADDHPSFATGIGRQIILAHVATILVIDMVKTGTMPPKIKEAVEKAGRETETPFSQKFVDHFIVPYWDNDACAEPTNCIADKLATTILEGAGEYSFDSEGVEFDARTLLTDVPEDLRSKNSAGKVSPEFFEQIRNFNESEEDVELLEKLRAGIRVGSKQLMLYFWRNAGKLRHIVKMELADSNDEMAYYAMVRDVILNHGDGPQWLAIDEEMRHRIIYNRYITDAFEIGPRGNGIKNEDAELTKELKARYAKFIVTVFAKDIVKYTQEKE